MEEQIGVQAVLVLILGVHGGDGAAADQHEGLHPPARRRQVKEQVAAVGDRHQPGPRAQRGRDGGDLSLQRHEVQRRVGQAQAAHARQKAGGGLGVHREAVQAAQLVVFHKEVHATEGAYLQFMRSSDPPGEEQGRQERCQQQGAPPRERVAPAG